MKSIFWPSDAEGILPIPLPNHNQPDFIAWQFTKTGCFSVKSAYHAEWQAEYRRRAQRRDRTSGSAARVEDDLVADGAT